ncbi:hypothetical protein G6F68_014277 [Rhizopus microsporus]|nr:hypothetical protein G6F68_014277 [Rhizopus microsporus]
MQCRKCASAGPAAPCTWAPRPACATTTAGTASCRSPRNTSRTASRTWGCGWTKPPEATHTPGGFRYHPSARRPASAPAISADHAPSHSQARVALPVLNTHTTMPVCKTKLANVAAMTLAASGRPARRGSANASTDVASAESA